MDFNFFFSFLSICFAYFHSQESRNKHSKQKHCRIFFQFSFAFCWFFRYSSCKPHLFLSSFCLSIPISWNLLLFYLFVFAFNVILRLWIKQNRNVFSTLQMRKRMSSRGLWSEWRVYYESNLRKTDGNKIFYAEFLFSKIQNKCVFVCRLMKCLNKNWDEIKFTVWKCEIHNRAVMISISMQCSHNKSNACERTAWACMRAIHLSVNGAIIQ